MRRPGRDPKAAPCLPVAYLAAGGGCISDRSMVTCTSSLTTTPPPSSARFQVIPKSLRLIVRRRGGADARLAARALDRRASAPSTSSATSLVTPCIVRSPTSLNLPGPAASARFETNVTVGNLAASKKSGLLRCSSRFGSRVSDRRDVDRRVHLEARQVLPVVLDGARTSCRTRRGRSPPSGASRRRTSASACCRCSRSGRRPVTTAHARDEDREGEDAALHGSLLAVRPDGKAPRPRAGEPGAGCRHMASASRARARRVARRAHWIAGLVCGEHVLRHGHLQGANACRLHLDPHPARIAAISGTARTGSKSGSTRARARFSPGQLRHGLRRYRAARAASPRSPWIAAT